MGLRYASFEETTDGAYCTTTAADCAGPPPNGIRTVDKSLQGDMLGAKLAGRGTYRIRPFSASVGVGYSALDGELEARSSLTPPAGTVPVLLIVWLGWEQQVWEDIAADLTRNLPDSDVPSRERDSVTFSWFKVGVSYRF